MLVRVFKYAFAQAWTRTLKGGLLGAEDWHFLLNMRMPEDFLRYLSGTAYAPLLSRNAGGRPTSSAFSSALYQHFFGQAARMMKVLPKGSTRIVAAWLLRYDAENLKTILRGVWQGRSPEEVQPLLYPLGSLSRLPVETLLHAGHIEMALDALGPTVFQAPTLHALAQHRAQQRLFPLEIAFDQTVFERLLTEVEALGGLDRHNARDLVGALVDGTNLSWLARFRHYYGISPQESINCLLPGGAHLTIEDLGRLARAPDLETFKASVAPALRKVLNSSTRWEQIQTLVEQWFAGKLHDVFMSDPFQIAVPLSYLFLKEIEVKTLESLYSSIGLEEPSDMRIETHALPVRGGDRV